MLALSLPVEKMEWTCAELPNDDQKVELVISTLKSLDEFYCYNYSSGATVISFVLSTLCESSC